MIQKIFHPDSGSRDMQLQGAIFNIMRPIHPNLKDKFTSPGNYFNLVYRTIYTITINQTYHLQEIIIITINLSCKLIHVENPLCF